MFLIQVYTNNIVHKRRSLKEFATLTNTVTNPSESSLLHKNVHSRQINEAQKKALKLHRGLKGNLCMTRSAGEFLRGGLLQE